jgi:Putative DNA-binding domain
MFMASLRNLQLGFAQSLWGDPQTEFLAHVEENALPQAQRLNVYCNNVNSNLQDALSSTYPVIQRLVGAEFFSYIAKQYLKVYASTTGDLNDFGGEFAKFLSRFPATGQLAYLPDVARLEWAYHEVFQSPFHYPVDFSKLASLPQHEYGDLKFVLQPASRLIHSEFPILRIWEVNQAEYKGDASVDLAEGGVNLLVIRRGLIIELETTTPGEFILLQAFQRNLNLSCAYDLASGVEAGLDFASFLPRVIRGGTVVDFFVTPTNVEVNHVHR